MKSFIVRPSWRQDELYLTVPYRPTLVDRIFHGKRTEYLRAPFKGKIEWLSCDVKFDGEDVSFNFPTYAKIPELVIEDVTLYGVFPIDSKETSDGGIIYILRYDNCVSLLDELRKDY